MAEHRGWGGMPQCLCILISLLIHSFIFMVCLCVDSYHEIDKCPFSFPFAITADFMSFCL